VEITKEGARPKSLEKTCEGQILERLGVSTGITVSVKGFRGRTLPPFEWRKVVPSGYLINVTAKKTRRNTTP